MIVEPRGAAGPGAPATSETDGRSAVAIVASLWEKLEALVQLEMKLALAEAEDKIGTLKRELFAKAVGGAVVLAGMLTLVAAIVAVLALAMDVWLAALLTGSALTVAGIMLLRRQAAPEPADTTPQTQAKLSATTKETNHGTTQQSV
jgi:hypothetical protein